MHYGGTDPVIAVTLWFLATFSLPIYLKTLLIQPPGQYGQYGQIFMSWW